MDVSYVDFCFCYSYLAETNLKLGKSDLEEYAEVKESRQVKLSATTLKN